jgi:hypothetical protein
MITGARHMMMMMMMMKRKESNGQLQFLVTKGEYFLINPYITRIHSTDVK